MDDREEVVMDSDDADDDMMLLEDYQVADFASSMLAAISCWHSRARALLSLGDPTVRAYCCLRLRLCLRLLPGCSSSSPG